LRVIRSTYCLAFLILFIGSSVSCNENAQSGIDATNRAFEMAVSRSDGAAVAALYTADGQLLPVQNDFVTGTQAIAAFWQGAFNAGIKGGSLETVEMESHGDTAHEVGTYRLLDANGKVLDHGKYIVIWKKEGSRWKIHRDIWTTSIAPEQP
jgi:uncharacterized protein (TIGR02246 family)